MTATMQSQTPPPATPGGYPAPRPTPAPRPMPQAAPMPQAIPMPQAAPMPQAVPMPQAAPMPHAAPIQQGAPMAPRPPQMAPPPPPHGVPQTAPMPQGAVMAPPPAHTSPRVEAVMPAAPLQDEHREDGDKMIPGIAIQAFCERKETGSVINSATHDWRMKRANVDIYMGGLNAAIDYYHNEKTPNLIMIETAMTGAELFTQLETLASVCDEGTQVVVIGATNDIRLYRQLMEKGVSDYLVPPLHPMTLIRSISELYLAEDAPFIGRAISIYGAKGGVGTSTIAHNLAWILSEKIGQETALIDLDETWGTTGIDFAYDTAQGLEEALSQSDRLDEALLDKIMVRHTKKLSILPTAASLGNGSAFQSPEVFEKVIDGVRAISPFSVFDMPHVWSEWASSTLTSSDEIVLIATPDLACLRNTKNLIDYLKAKRPNDPDPIVIVNQVGRSKIEIPLKDFGAAIGIEPAMSLAFDPDTFTEASNDGKMLTDIKSAAPHVDGLNYLAARLRTGRFPDMNAGRKAKSNRSGSLMSRFKKK